MRTLYPKRAEGKKTAGKRLVLAALVAIVVMAFPALIHATEMNSGVLMSGADRAAVTRAVQAARQGRWSQALSTVKDARDPLALKIVQWLYFTRSEDSKLPFDKITAFIRQNPDWPEKGSLRLAAEKAMPRDLPDSAVAAWFKDNTPKTPDGMHRYVQALVDQGRKDDAEKALRPWWKDARLTPDQQADFLKRYGSLFDRQSHVGRLGILLMQKQYTNARALARYIGRGYPDLIVARIALAEGSANANAAVSHVPPHLTDDPGFLYERLRWRRRNNNDYGAIEILHRMPPAEVIPNPEDWWVERNILIRRLIDNKQYQSAYLLAAKCGCKEGHAFAESQFLAGWMALRFLNEPWKAFEHFEALYHGTETPISRARGAYWAGKASLALKNEPIAREWFRVAARHQTTFYGQMAIGELADEYKPPQQLPPERTLEGKERFDKMEMVQAAKILNGAHMRGETKSFLNALAEGVKTPEDYRLVAELSEELGYADNAVRIAKKGLAKGVLLMDQLYPTILNRMQNVKVEWALVHALIRQESAFDENAQSPVGALGLMQLMPATAKMVARKHSLSQSESRLLDDPAHNVRIGSLYLQQLLDRYDGSYPLALAAYNAGPGRVDEWLRLEGDPRKGRIDMVDWIELIPYSETRNYVQRVLESIYVYRIKMRNVQKSFNSPIHVAIKL